MVAHSGCYVLVLTVERVKVKMIFTAIAHDLYHLKTLKT
jgi:hypothetical protein